MLGNKSMLQQTIERAIQCSKVSSKLKIVTTNNFLKNAKDQINIFNDLCIKKNIICEPFARNTAAAIIYSTLNIYGEYGSNSICWVMPSDHHINKEENLIKSLAIAYEHALKGKIVTFGIKPKYPETGYGYINFNGSGDANKIERFVEKPDLNMAKKYMNSGKYLWNSGMFVFRCDELIKEFEKHAPEILRMVKDYMRSKNSDIYEAIENLGFDKAVMEKTENGVVIKCDIDWSDIGCHKKLNEIYKDNDNIRKFIISRHPQIYEINNNYASSG